MKKMEWKDYQFKFWWFFTNPYCDYFQINFVQHIWSKTKFCYFLGSHTKNMIKDNEKFNVTTLGSNVKLKDI